MKLIIVMHEEVSSGQLQFNYRNEMPKKKTANTHTKV
ncbi:hypothetical protein AEQU2_02849 [Aequorivita lipolytica]|nr:hypothetical protein AEQU2_02849 [Aequorivita lipolytica]